MSRVKCPKCDNLIIIRYLQPGETAKCKACGADIIVPEEGENAKLASSGDNQSANKPTKTTPLKPIIRFHALRNISRTFKNIGWVVEIMAVLLSIVIWTSSSRGGDWTRFVWAAIPFAIGSIIALLLNALGDLIMVGIANEENTRAIRELLENQKGNS